MAGNSSIAEQVLKIEELPSSSDTIEAMPSGNGFYVLGIDTSHDREKG
ncbi:MAG: hypothetical protein ACLQPD_09515 [Desulfomonilaceae bacterium]